MTDFKKNKLALFIILFIIFAIIHIVASGLITALLAGWGDVNPIGSVLRVLICILIPFLLLGKCVSFLGVGIYILSASIWSIVLSSILIRLTYKKNAEDK